MPPSIADSGPACVTICRKVPRSALPTLPDARSLAAGGLRRLPSANNATQTVLGNHAIHLTAITASRTFPSSIGRLRGFGYSRCINVRSGDKLRLAGSGRTESIGPQNNSIGYSTTRNQLRNADDREVLRKQISTTTPASSTLALAALGRRALVTLVRTVSPQPASPPSPGPHPAWPEAGLRAKPVRGRPHRKQRACSGGRDSESRRVRD